MTRPPKPDGDDFAAELENHHAAPAFDEPDDEGSLVWWLKFVAALVFAVGFFGFGLLYLSFAMVYFAERLLDLLAGLAGF